MNGRLLLVFALMGLAVAGTKSYIVKVFEAATWGSTELQPGSYKVEIVDQKAVIHNGKQTIEVPVKVETNSSKYAETSVRLSNENSKYRVDEIHLGGTSTKLVLGESSGVSAGQQF